MNKEYYLEEKNRFQKVAMTFLNQSTEVLTRFQASTVGGFPDWPLFDEYIYLYDMYKKNMDDSDHFWKLYVAAVNVDRAELVAIQSILDKIEE